MKFRPAKKVVYVPLFAALSVLAFAGLATASEKGRGYALANQLIGKMENQASCAVRAFRLGLRGVRPTPEHRACSAALLHVDNAVGRLRSAFDGDRGFSRVHYEFNQLENKFKGAVSRCERAKVSPAVRGHLRELGSAIASFKRLQSSQYGLSGR